MSKVWFITGCSKGFGKILTEELLQNTDATVIATARKLEALEPLRTQFKDRLLVLPLDVTKLEDIKSSVSTAISKFGRIDVLVNNAGYGLMGALEECSQAEIHKIFDTNVFGLMEVTRAVLPIMRAQKSGHIINFSSVLGLVGMPGGGIYNSTKFAVEGLSEALAYDVSSFNIKVTIVEPGPFRTDFAGGSIVMGKAMPEYNESPAASIRGYIDGTNGKQPGDPVKAAKILISITDMDKPPLRIALGKIAADRIINKYKAQALEFEQFKALTLSADFD